MKKLSGLLAAILLLFAVSFVSDVATAAPNAYRFTVTGPKAGLRHIEWALYGAIPGLPSMSTSFGTLSERAVIVFCERR